MTSLAFCPKRTPPRPRPPEATLAVSRVLAKSSIQIYGMGSGEREQGERERERGSHGRGRFHRIGDRRTEEITAEGERTAGRPGRRGRLRAKYLPWGLWEHKGGREAREEEGPSPRGGQSERPTRVASGHRAAGREERTAPRQTDRPTVRQRDNADAKFSIAQQELKRSRWSESDGRGRGRWDCLCRSTQSIRGCIRMYRECTETHFIVRSRFGEVCSCCSLTVQLALPDYIVLQTF